MQSVLHTKTLRAVENVLNQLRNDIRTVAEARCGRHGTGGGTTANSAAALLPCIAIEMVARRTSAIGESKDAQIRRVVSEIATLTGYDAYRTMGFALFKGLRNGLAHSFWPIEVSANGCEFGILPEFWIDGSTQRSVCIDELGDYVQSGHLVVTPLGSSARVLRVSALHWARVVSAYIDEFLRRLRGDATLQSTVEAADEALGRSSGAGLFSQMTPAERSSLGL